MKKSLLAMAVCCAMLAGCGPEGEPSDSSLLAESQDIPAQSSPADEAGEEADGETEMSLEPEEGTYELTLYNGEVVTTRKGDYMIVSLGNTDQLFETDTLDILLDDTLTMHFPAENLSAAIENYDAVSASDDFEVREASDRADNLKMRSLSLPGVKSYVWPIFDNESEAEDVDVLTLPVTELDISVQDGGVTIQGFRFKKWSFSFDELLAAWGEPIGVEINCRTEQASNGGEERPYYNYEYYWRFNNGYIAVRLEGNADDDGLNADRISMVQWDTLACKNENVYGIPKYGEE